MYWGLFISSWLLSVCSVWLQTWKSTVSKRIKKNDFSEQYLAHLAQSVIFAYRCWVASWLWQNFWSSHHLQAPCDLLFPTYTHLSVTDVGKQQWATDRRTGTCQHAEHCTLFWHNRNACFPTQALDTKHVLTTVLLDDNSEVYVILRLCNQKISAPLFFCAATT